MSVEQESQDHEMQDAVDEIAAMREVQDALLGDQEQRLRVVGHQTV